jgi:hypothetical protein
MFDPSQRIEKTMQRAFMQITYLLERRVCNFNISHHTNASQIGGSVCPWSSAQHEPTAGSSPPPKHARTLTIDR